MSDVRDVERIKHHGWGFTNGCVVVTTEGRHLHWYFREFGKPVDGDPVPQAWRERKARCFLCDSAHVAGGCEVLNRDIGTDDERGDGE